MTNTTCENCKFFLSFNEDDAGPHWFGECRRMPPRAADINEKLMETIFGILEIVSSSEVDRTIDRYDRMASFPLIENTDWCGEHKPITQQRELTED